jgi:hypothetical protein
LGSQYSLSLRIIAVSTASSSVTRGRPINIEFTSQQGHEVGKAPTQEHLMVFYIPDKNEWEASCAQMISAGFRQVPSYNAYWDLQGKTLEDIDGYRIVLQNAPWTK